MRNIQVLCDGCQRDITETGNSVDYRLLLIADRLPISGNTVTDMMIYPPIKRDHHFCGLDCLKDWITK